MQVKIMDYQNGTNSIILHFSQVRHSVESVFATEELKAWHQKWRVSYLSSATVIHYDFPEEVRARDEGRKLASWLADQDNIVEIQDWVTPHRVETKYLMLVPDWF